MWFGFTLGRLALANPVTATIQPARQEEKLPQTAAPSPVRASEILLVYFHLLAGGTHPGRLDSSVLYQTLFKKYPQPLNLVCFVFLN